MEENPNWLQNPLLKNRLSQVTNRDVVKRIKKYYPNVRRSNNVRSADVISTAIYIMHKCLGEGDKGRYTVEDIKLFFEINNNYVWQKYIKRHHRRCDESMIYLQRFLLIVLDLHKLNEKINKTINDKINLPTESK